MGAIAEAIAAYSQPLIDGSDGSIEQVRKAIILGQACWNIAILPKEDRESSITELGKALAIADEEFEDLRCSILLPMIRRHEEMFPQMHRRDSMMPFWESSSQRHLPAKSPEGKSSEPGRYAPCPCNSGKKYKFCCGRAVARSS
jgi:uncharacterized protein YecA (UPF0149 family)